jgi:hypothetical protein
VELWGFRDDGHELLAPVAGVVDVEPEEAGRVGVAESAEEFGVGGADKKGGEAEAEQDLVEQVVVFQRSRRYRRRRGGSVAVAAAAGHSGPRPWVRYWVGE